MKTALDDQRAKIIAAARAHAVSCREMIEKREIEFRSQFGHQKQWWILKGAADALDTFANEIEAWKP